MQTQDGKPAAKGSYWTALPHSFGGRLSANYPPQCWGF